MFKRIPSSPLCWEEMSDVIYGYAYLFSKPFPTRGVKSHTSRTSRVYGLVFLWGAHIRPFPVLRSAFGPLCQCWDPDATEPGGERLANSQLEKSCLVTNFLLKKKQTNKSFFGLFFLCFPATRSCHHRLLRCCSRARGSGRHVLQQLLPLPALAGGSERRHGAGPVGAQRAAGPRRAGRPVRLSARSARPRTLTHPVCVHRFRRVVQGPSHVPPTHPPEERE